MTTTIDLAPYRAALEEGYSANVKGSPRQAPKSDDPDIIANWLDGWDEAASHAAQYHAGGFQSRD